MSKKKQKGISIRMLIPMVAVVLLLGCAIGGTIAWLTAQTDPVVNTFTIGKVEIDLWESKYDPETNKYDLNTPVKSNTYKIVPGRNMPKDPYVTIKEGSEPCWLFVKVEANNFIDGLSYNMCYGWNKLSGETDIYYLEYTPANLVKINMTNTFNESGVVDYTDEYSILDGLIYVDGDIDMDQLKGKAVSLNFKAYAIQYEGFPTVQKAWEEVNKTFQITNTSSAVTAE